MAAILGNTTPETTARLYAHLTHPSMGAVVDATDAQFELRLASCAKPNEGTFEGASDKSLMGAVVDATDAQFELRLASCAKPNEGTFEGASDKSRLFSMWGVAKW